jgi:osmoprotectant transport system ATP-binding protein
VFVTHDIDEAVKLGDKVAVFGPGGTLQQYDEPARLLATPANDFVAGFIGTDRGYRLLQFFHASGVPLHDIQRAGEWELVTKPDGSSLGWRKDDEVVAGGSLLRPDGTLRQALDAALSSPSGIGLAVDAAGTVTGGFRAVEVLEAIEQQQKR